MAASRRARKLTHGFMVLHYPCQNCFVNSESFGESDHLSKCRGNFDVYNSAFLGGDAKFVACIIGTDRR